MLSQELHRGRVDKTHCLQKRDTIGWWILAAYLGSKFLTGFLLGSNLITVPTAELLDWLSVAIKWGFMAEALFWMIKERKNGKEVRL